MKNKKLRAVHCAAVVAAAFLAVGCGKKAVGVETTSGIENETGQEMTVQERETETKTESGQESDSQNKNLSPLLLEITTEYDADREDGHLLITTSTSQVHILSEGHEMLKKALDALNQKNLDLQKTFLENNAEDAREMYRYSPEQMGDQGWESEFALTATRADETVLSLKQADYSWLGGAHPYTYVNGINYDSQTGTELSLKDIAKDYDGVYAYVCKKLQEEHDPTTFFAEYEDTVKAMFYGEGDNQNSVQWFLTDDGMTVWFNQYEIAPYSSGPIIVEIPFTGNEDLFQAQYMTSKTSYIRNLSEDASVEADVNGDGKKESISYTVERDTYENGGAITVTCGDISFSTKNLIDEGNYEASGGYESEGYLIHTEDGKTYLYLQHLADADGHYINIFDLTTGVPSYVGFTGSSWFQSPITDLEQFVLWNTIDVLGTYNAYKVYHIGEDGMPQTEDTLFQIDPMTENDRNRLVSTRDLEVTILESDSKKQETLPAGTSYTIIATDEKSFAEARLEDGRICRIALKKDEDNWEWKINGIGEYECFETVIYAN